MWTASARRAGVRSLSPTTVWGRCVPEDDVPAVGLFYHWTMLRAATGFVRERLRRRGELIPVGITWPFVIITDGLVLFGGGIAVLQRPSADLPAALVASAITVSPLVAFFFFNMK